MLLYAHKRSETSDWDSKHSLWLRKHSAVIHLEDGVWNELRRKRSRLYPGALSLRNTDTRSYLRRLSKTRLG